MGVSKLDSKLTICSFTPLLKMWQALVRCWHLDKGNNMAWPSHFLLLLAQGQDALSMNEAAKTPIETFKISGIMNQSQLLERMRGNSQQEKSQKGEQLCKSLADPNTIYSYIHTANSPATNKIAELIFELLPKRDFEFLRQVNLPTKTTTKKSVIFART